MSRFAPLALAAAISAPLPALAHPHVFIDAGLEIIFDEAGQLTHIKVTWAYDDFYSLLMAEDMGFDKDGDGALTPDEEAQLSGFDANWIEGFNGDLVATLEGQPLQLSNPIESTARMIMGRIVSTHLREVAGTPAVAGDTLSIKVFDETFYTAYDLTLPVTLVGASGCLSERFDPDIDAEMARMQAMLLTIDESADLEEMEIPLIGEAFATDLQITCPGS
ncbi:MAG: DUF1007 family protein [Pseudomonadota bacterium]